MDMRSSIGPTLILLLLASVALSPVIGAQETATVTVTAKERGCTGGKNFCFEHTIDGVVAAGSTILVELIVPESLAATHNLYLTVTEDYDTTHADSDGEAAEGQTAEEVRPGESDSFTVDVPADATELYYWCDIPGHESLGMWGTLSVQEPSTGGDAGGDEPAGSPGPGLLLALAGLAGAAFLLRRRD